MSQKVNVTSELANVIKVNLEIEYLNRQACGYKGDLGYHQLVYPSAGELRKLLMWLVDNVPKTSIDTDASGKAGLFRYQR